MDFCFLIRKANLFVAVRFVVEMVYVIRKNYGAKICLPLAKNFRTIEPISCLEPLHLPERFVCY
jgi:hypothetical protein